MNHGAYGGHGEQQKQDQPPRRQGRQEILHGVLGVLAVDAAFLRVPRVLRGENLLFQQ